MASNFSFSSAMLPAVSVGLEDVIGHSAGFGQLRRGQAGGRTLGLGEEAAVPIVDAGESQFDASWTYLQYLVDFEMVLQAENR